jgi:hypothetical protein
MPYALVNDIPVTWATYEQVAAPALDELPDGLILHVAGPTDEGVRVIDVWDTEDAYQTFLTGRLQPLLARTPGSATAALFRDLDVHHIVSAATPPKQPST